MRNNYWMDLYQIRSEILLLLDKCGILYAETKEGPPNTYSHRIDGNGAIALICEDVNHPELPTSFCTPLGKLKIVGNNGAFFSKASGKKTTAFLEEMECTFNLTTIDGDNINGQSYPAYAITRIPWREKYQKIALPIFVTFTGSATWEEDAKAKRVYKRVLASRKKAQVS